MSRILAGKAIIAGSAEGLALVSGQPLSFWGGYCPKTGEIIDRRHERSGAIGAGRVFVFPTGRGSSTSSAILLESIRAGTAPAAVVNLKTDPILALGAIVADELYGRSVPMVILSENDFFSICEGDRVAIGPDGTVTVDGSQGRPPAARDS